jgi:hypothetical protein
MLSGSPGFGRDPLFSVKGGVRSLVREYREKHELVVRCRACGHGRAVVELVDERVVSISCSSCSFVIQPGPGELSA